MREQAAMQAWLVCASMCWTARIWGISPHFRLGRHRPGAEEYRREMADRFTTWNEVTGTATAA